LQPDELCTSATYATEGDFAPALSRLRGLARRHNAELQQWHAADGVSPTLGALLGLLRFLQGLAPARRYQPGDRRKLCGLGVQVPLRWLGEVLDRDKSTVCDALKEGRRKGLLLRYAPIRRVSRLTGGRLKTVVTRDGVERKKVNVHGVLYLTPKGAEWCDRRGTTVQDLGRRKRRLSGRRGRVLTGLLADVLDTLREVRRLLAARFASAEPRPTPDEEAPHVESNFGVAPPVDNGPAPPGEAVRPGAADDWTGSSGPHVAARGSGITSALPTHGTATPGAPGGPPAPRETHAGLTGEGAFSTASGKPRGVGYGPPLRQGDYLRAEIERCWTRHVLVEGGPPRRVVRKVRSPGGVWLGDSREELEPGLVWRWAPALTAPEAYPNEWRAARGLAPVRAQLVADFRLYLGPALARRFAEAEARRGAGGAVVCPVEGCPCMEMGGVPARGLPSPAVPRTRAEARAAWDEQLRAARARREREV
jgi:hypothetical protein